MTKVPDFTVGLPVDDLTVRSSGIAGCLGEARRFNSSAWRLESRSFPQDGCKASRVKSIIRTWAVVRFGVRGREASRMKALSIGQDVGKSEQDRLRLRSFEFRDPSATIGRSMNYWSSNAQQRDRRAVLASDFDMASPRLSLVVG